MHIIRQVDERGAHRLLLHGQVIDNDYVDPDTVRVFTIWSNFSGVDQIGPELMTDNNAGKKLANRIAVHLTKLFRKGCHD